MPVDALLECTRSAPLPCARQTTSCKDLRFSANGPSGTSCAAHQSPIWPFLAEVNGQEYDTSDQFHLYHMERPPGNRIAGNRITGEPDQKGRMCTGLKWLPSKTHSVLTLGSSRLPAFGTTRLDPDINGFGVGPGQRNRQACLRNPEGVDVQLHRLGAQGGVSLPPLMPGPGQSTGGQVAFDRLDLRPIGVKEHRVAGPGQNRHHHAHQSQGDNHQRQDETALSACLPHNAPPFPAS